MDAIDKRCHAGHNQLNYLRFSVADPPEYPVQYPVLGYCLRPSTPILHNASQRFKAALLRPTGDLSAKALGSP
jgi:hypothetical protein